VVVRRAVASVGGADPALLDGFLDSLAAACREARRLRRHEVDRHRAIGVSSAERGVPLGVVVDLYLTATSLAWPLLPRPAHGGPDETTAVVLRAANDAIAAVTAGYQAAQHAAIRSEEAVRREFIDDLLHGHVDPARLAELASRYGLQLAAAYCVAVAETTRPFTDSDERTRQVESALRRPAGAGAVLVTTKDGQLVCVSPSTRSDTATEFAGRVRTVAHPANARVGIGRSRSGPSGIAQSYQEARDTLTMAGRLGLPGPVLHARDLLVYQVLFRDRAAIGELVASTRQTRPSSTRCAPPSSVRGCWTGPTRRWTGSPRMTGRERPGAGRVVAGVPGSLVGVDSSTPAGGPVSQRSRTPPSAQPAACGWCT
jgi:hypothetical protein